MKCADILQKADIQKCLLMKYYQHFAKELNKSSILLSIFILIISSFAAGGCARTQMQKIMPDVTHMVVARHYFGEPTRSLDLPDGTKRHEWILDRVFQHPGGIETQRIYVGHDRDGYREYYERDVYVPPWSEQQYCRMSLIANAEGAVLQTEWEGSHCDDLPRVRSLKQ